MRFSYSSMTTPAQVFDYNMRTRERVLLKTQEVPSGHDPDHYVTRRLMAPSHDGELVPISLIYHRDTPLDGSAPCLLYGYGSYGITDTGGLQHQHPVAGRSRLRLRASRMSAAARTRAFPGTRTASGRRRRTLSAISSRPHEHLVSAGYTVARPHRRTGRLGRRHADGRRRQHGARCTSAASSPKCRSSTC